MRNNTVTGKRLLTTVCVTVLFLLKSSAKSVLVYLHPPMEELPFYTRSQLALRNGQDKPEIWVAYKGIIYDVTDSRLWRNGHHYEHWAGQDLTDELPMAPHTQKVFDRVKPVGRLLH